MHSDCPCKHDANPWISSANNQIKPYPVQQGFTGFVQQSSGLGDLKPTLGSNFHSFFGSASVDAIADLIQKDSSFLTLRGFNGQVALHHACLRGDLEIINLLLDCKADPNALDDFGESPLHFACKRGNVVIMHKLIQCGADVRLEDRAGKAALHQAAHGGNVLALHYLLESCGLNVHIRDRNLSTPMHIVCMHGHVEAFEYLLKKDRSDLFSKDAQGNTLLHIAASHGNGLMCYRLLEKAGSRLLFEMNAEGCTPLDMAKRGSRPFAYTNIVTMLKYFMSISSPAKDRSIEGPKWAWYGLLALPFAMYPVTILVAMLFINKIVVVLSGVVAMLALRAFHSHRMNHALRWPSPAHAGLFAAGMFYTTVYYYLQIFPFIYIEHKGLVCSSAILTVVMILAYVKLLRKDPGVVKVSNRKANGDFFTITDVASKLVTVKEFCIECEIVAPSLTTHCKLCQKCYHRLDHHCLYLYRCIAAGNHRLFVFFNIIVIISMLLFEYACLLYLNVIYPSYTLDLSFAYKVVFFEPCLWSLAMLNAVSIIWGFWLMKVQFDAVSKGRILSYHRTKDASRLTAKQKIMNIVHFVIDQEPYATDDSFVA